MLSIIGLLIVSHYMFYTSTVHVDEAAYVLVLVHRGQVAELAVLPLAVGVGLEHGFRRQRVQARVHVCRFAHTRAARAPEHTKTEDIFILFPVILGYVWTGSLRDMLCERLCMFSSGFLILHWKVLLTKNTDFSI